MMRVPGHDPKWPDKVIFAAMLVVIAGVLGVIFAILQLAGAKIGQDVSTLRMFTPPSVALALSLLMLLVGLYAIRHQAAVWVWIGIGTGVASTGMLGFVPFLSLVAIAFLVMSKKEEEETRYDDVTMPASMWPDKALAASLLILVAALVGIFQAALLFGGSLTPPILKPNPDILGYINLAGGLWGIYAAHEAFHLRRAWPGHIAAVLAFIGVGFWIIGPALAIGAVILLFKAHQEDEFVDTSAAA